jgi:acetate---CoA ligase (ADP-forming)
VTSAADLLFHPRSIVVYGASSDPEKLSGRPLAYLAKLGYAGDVYAVNPRRTEVQGVRAYADVASVPGPVDLAVVVVPAESVREALQRCGEAGVRAAIVFASGFGEIGDAGRPAQDELAAIAARSGMHLLGPNCLGSFAAPDSAFATFSTAFDDDDAERRDSPIGLVTQSGAVGTFTYSMMNRSGVGVRYFANTGNEADITAVELLRALVDAEDVELLMGHLEGVKNAGAFEDLVQATDRRGKPLLLLKAGRTPSGARAVAAHTASTAGDDAAFDAVLAGGGAIRLRSMEAMADAALLFVTGRRPDGARLSIVTLSGGAGALAADAAVEEGLVVEPWSPAAREQLAAELPYYGSTANPIDVTGSMINDIGILGRTLAAALDNADTDSVLVVMGNADRGAEEIVAAVQAAYAATEKPFAVAWTGGSGRGLTRLQEGGIPAYPDPTRAVAALAHLTRFSGRQAGRGTASRASVTSGVRG